jgi:superfamily II DNA or RNA helicase
MALLFKRSTLLYQAREKQEAAKKLIHALLQSGRRKLIIFFERIQSAEAGIAEVELQLAESLRLSVATPSFWTDVLHSEVKDEDRKPLLDKFRAAERGVLFACRMLDEGFDVPDVDAAVLVASTKSKRQRIQRVGRVLRRGDGKKQPVVITLMCARTTDEFVAADDRSLFGQTTQIHTTYLASALDWLRTHPRRN